MNHYLMVYEREQGRVLHLEPCPDAVSAMRARFAAERLHRANRDIEIVILGAQTEAALRETHARYFEGAGELALSGVRHVELSVANAPR